MLPKVFGGAISIASGNVLDLCLGRKMNSIPRNVSAAYPRARQKRRAVRITEALTIESLFVKASLHDELDPRIIASMPPALKLAMGTKETKVAHPVLGKHSRQPSLGDNDYRGTCMPVFRYIA